MILLLAIFIAIFMLICIKNIRYGVYAVIFCMPLYLIKFPLFGIPSTVLEVMIYVLFLFWILNKIQKHYLSFPQKRESIATNIFTIVTIRKIPILNIGILLLFIGVIISTALSSDIKTSLGIFKGWFFDPFLFFVVFVSVIKKREHVALSLASWLFSGVVVSLISIFYLLNNELTYDGRLKALFLSPNHLAMYLAPAFLIVLFFLLNRRSLDRKVFSIEYLVLSICLLVIFIPLYFTYSYGAFLGIIIGIVYLLVVGNKNDRKNKLLIIILLSFIFIGFAFTTSSKFDQIINSDSRSSFHSRLMIWNAAGEILKDNPLFGIGPGTFQDAYLSYADKFNEPYLEWAVPQPHNIFLAFYLQTGLIGFVGFILILIWFFSRRDCRDAAVLRLYSIDANADKNVMNRISAITRIINALMIYILIHGLIDTTYWKNDLSLMFWIIIAIAVVNEKNYNNDIKT